MASEIASEEPPVGLTGLFEINVGKIEQLMGWLVQGHKQQSGQLEEVSGIAKAAATQDSVAATIQELETKMQSAGTASATALECLEVRFMRKIDRMENDMKELDEKNAKRIEDAIAARVEPLEKEMARVKEKLAEVDKLAQGVRTEMDFLNKGKKKRKDDTPAPAPPPPPPPAPSGGGEISPEAMAQITGQIQKLQGELLQVKAEASDEVRQLKESIPSLDSLHARLDELDERIASGDQGTDVQAVQEEVQALAEKVARLEAGVAQISLPEDDEEMNALASAIKEFQKLLETKTDVFRTETLEKNMKKCQEDMNLRAKSDEVKRLEIRTRKDIEPLVQRSSLMEIDEKLKGLIALKADEASLHAMRDETDLLKHSVQSKVEDERVTALEEKLSAIVDDGGDLAAKLKKLADQNATNAPSKGEDAGVDSFVIEEMRRSLKNNTKDLSDLMAKFQAAEGSITDLGTTMERSEKRISSSQTQVKADLQSMKIQMGEKVDRSEMEAMRDAGGLDAPMEDMEAPPIDSGSEQMGEAVQALTAQLNKVQQLANTLRAQVASKCDRQQVSVMIDTVRDAILATLGDGGEEEGTSQVAVRIDLLKINLASVTAKVADVMQQQKTLSETVCVMRNLEGSEEERPATEDTLWERIKFLEEKTERNTTTTDKKFKQATDEMNQTIKQLRMTADEQIAAAIKSATGVTPPQKPAEKKAASGEEKEAGAIEVPEGFGWALREMAGRVNILQTELAMMKGTVSSHTSRLSDLDSTVSHHTSNLAKLQTWKENADKELMALVQKAESFHENLRKCQKSVRDLKKNVDDNAENGSGPPSGAYEATGPAVNEDELFEKMSDVIAFAVQGSEKELSKQIAMLRKEVEVLKRAFAEVPAPAAAPVADQVEVPMNMDEKASFELANINRTLTAHGKNLVRFEQSLEQLQTDVAGKADTVEVEKLHGQMKHRTDEINALAEVIDQANKSVDNFNEQLHKVRREKAGKDDLLVVEADLGEIMESVKKLQNRPVESERDDEAIPGNVSEDLALTRESLNEIASQMIRLQKRQTSIAWAVVTMAGGSREKKAMEKLPGGGQYGTAQPTTPEGAAKASLASTQQLAGADTSSEAGGAAPKSEGKSGSPRGILEAGRVRAAREGNPEKPLSESAATKLAASMDHESGSPPPTGEAGVHTLDSDWKLLMQAWDDMIQAAQLKPKANLSLSLEAGEQLHAALYHLARHENLVQEKIGKQEAIELIEKYLGSVSNNSMLGSSAVVRQMLPGHGGGDSTTCMSCHQPVADPVTNASKPLTDEGLNQARGMNVAPKVAKFQAVHGTSPHEVSSRLTHPPLAAKGAGKQKDVPHLIREDIAEWEYDTDRPRQRQEDSVRFPPINQRPLHGRNQ